MRNIRSFYLKIFIFWVVKFSVYLNRRVLVMLFIHAVRKENVSFSIQTIPRRSSFVVIFLFVRQCFYIMEFVFLHAR